MCILEKLSDGIIDKGQVSPTSSSVQREEPTENKDTYQQQWETDVTTYEKFAKHNENHALQLVVLSSGLYHSTLKPSTQSPAFLVVQTVTFCPGWLYAIIRIIYQLNSSIYR